MFKTLFDHQNKSLKCLLKGLAHAHTQTRCCSSMQTIRVIIAFELSELELCHFKRLQGISMVKPQTEDKETSLNRNKVVTRCSAFHIRIALWLRVYCNDLSLERRCQRWGIERIAWFWQGIWKWEKVPFLVKNIVFLKLRIYRHTNSNARQKLN